MPQSQPPPRTGPKLDDDSGNGLSVARPEGHAGLRGLFENKFIVAITLFLTIGGFLVGYDQGIINNIIYMESFGAAFPNLYMNPSLTAWCVSTLLIAAAFGSYVDGTVCDKTGRKESVKYSVLIFLIGSSLQTGATSSKYLFAGRAVAGYALGCLTHVIPMYIAEISTANIRGFLISLLQLAVTVGVSETTNWIADAMSLIGGTRCAPGVPYTGPLLKGSPTFDPYKDVPVGGCTGQTQASWRVPLGLQLFPALCLGIGMFFMPDSPGWLAESGREEEAAQTLSRLRRKPADDNSVRFELLEIMAEVRYTREVTKAIIPNAGPYRLWVQMMVSFTSKKMTKRLFVGCLPMSFQQNMVGAIIYYAPLVFSQMNLHKNTTSLLVGLFGLVNIFATLPGVILVDRVGRRPLLLSGAVGCFMCMVVVGTIITVHGSHWPSNGVAVQAIIAFLFLFNIFFSYSWNSVGLVIPSEIFPLHHRSVALSFTTPSIWVSNFMATLSLPGFIEKSGGLAYYMTAAVCLLGFIAVKFAFPETNGYALTDMDTAFGSKVTDSEREHKERIYRDLGLPVKAPLTV
ncbi:general substrate transporter [Rhizopogon vinicolor AM-OR11-026]|uniref:General substrate transporter n=1 Tax=Rhizopogon vinicolor AM-OR11-026 TaxID=1314800 RepID=A0A1B7MVE7_9AGAM|nr:general substrate transporter [Rhizopogon vinicolor AM-OR11-026]